MKNPKGYDVFSLYEDDYPPAVEGKVDKDSLGQKVPEGKFGPSVTTIGTPVPSKSPGEVSIGGTPSTPSKPGGDVNIGGNK